MCALRTRRLADGVPDRLVYAVLGKWGIVGHFGQAGFVGRSSVYPHRAFARSPISRIWVTAQASCLPPAFLPSVPAWAGTVQRCFQFLPDRVALQVRRDEPVWASYRTHQAR